MMAMAGDANTATANTGDTDAGQSDPYVSALLKQGTQKSINSSPFYMFTVNNVKICIPFNISNNFPSFYNS